jgi:hypothetical protein
MALWRLNYSGSSSLVFQVKRCRIEWARDNSLPRIKNENFRSAPSVQPIAVTSLYVYRQHWFSKCFSHRPLIHCHQFPGAPKTTGSSLRERITDYKRVQLHRITRHIHWCDTAVPICDGIAEANDLGAKSKSFAAGAGSHWRMGWGGGRMGRWGFQKLKCIEWGDSEEWMPRHTYM